MKASVERKKGETVNTEILVKQIDGVIETNFDEVKDYLNGQLEIYRGMVFTEETKDGAKKTVAELRKLSKSIDDKRKEVKKTYMKPYEAFEAKMKELTGLVQEPIDLINVQIDEFEAKRIAEKKKLISELYAENIPDDCKGILTLERIYNSKWENATTTKKSITDDMQTAAINLKSNVEMIKSMKEECEEEALNALYKTLNLADAISYINDYKAKKAAILERQKAEEERRKAEEEKKVEEEQVEMFSAEQTEPETAVFEITGDAFDFARVETALENLEVTFRRIS